MSVALEAVNFWVQNLWKGTEPELLLPRDLQPHLARIQAENNPYRIARTSLKEALGDQVCDSLCADAFTTLIQAERFFLEGSPVVPANPILAGIATAFEHQLDYVLMNQVRMSLKGKPVQDLSSCQKRLADGKASLGDKLEIMRERPPKLIELCTEMGINLTDLQEVVNRVKKVRNDASHTGVTHTLEQARLKRKEWFGLDKNDGGIFALLAKPRPWPESPIIAI